VRQLMAFQSGPQAALVYLAGCLGTPADPNIPPEGEPSGIVRGKHRAEGCWKTLHTHHCFEVSRERVEWREAPET
jgi:hypothetical protein